MKLKDSEKYNSLGCERVFFQFPIGIVKWQHDCEVNYVSVKSVVMVD